MAIDPMSICLLSTYTRDRKLFKLFQFSFKNQGGPERDTPTPGDIAIRLLFLYALFLYPNAFPFGGQLLYCMGGVQNRQTLDFSQSLNLR